MARLINNKGTWHLQIAKNDSKGLVALLSDLPSTYLKLESQDEETFTFGFCEWDYDGMEDRTEMYSISDLRAILSKISENPDPDLIIPRDPEPVFDTPLTDEEYEELVKTMATPELMQHPKVFSYLLAKRHIRFLEAIGSDLSINHETFKWSEEAESLFKKEPGQYPEKE